MNAQLENHLVVNDADEYERQIGQELPHKRCARLRFSAPDELFPPMPLIEVDDPAFFQDQAE